MAYGVARDLRQPQSAWRISQSIDGGELLASSEELLGGYVHALTVTLAQVDPDTWDHSRRVAELAVAIGEQLDLPFASVRRLAVAGLVHDIGKLRIPHGILHKTGKLSGEEFQLIKSHPTWGFELLSHLRGFDDELPLVLGHHEKLSGKGYPQGLAGDDIPLEVRIMTAADVYDALTGARSYKDGWSVEMSLGIMWEEAGESFDPRVLDALIEVLIARGVYTREAAEAAEIHSPNRPEIPSLAAARAMRDAQVAHPAMLLRAGHLVQPRGIPASLQSTVTAHLPAAAVDQELSDAA